MATAVVRRGAPDMIKQKQSVGLCELRLPGRLKDKSGR
jgi:hypothetical protein